VKSTPEWRQPARRARCASIALVLLIVGLPLGANQATAQSTGRAIEDSWFLRSRTDGYAFQTVAPGESTQTQNHFGLYQYLDGAWNNLGNGKWDVRFSTRFADDLDVSGEFLQPDRLHTAYVQYRFGRASRARLGRMFVQDGPASYTMDGLHLAWSATRRLQFSAWGGSRSPYGVPYEIGSLSDQGTVGARAKASLARWLDLSAGWAYLDRNSYVQWQKVGGEAQIHPSRKLRGLLRGYYELESESWDKVEAVGWYQPTPEWPVFGFQYLDRRQQVDVNTYFARFLPYLERVRLGRVSARYESARHWGAEVSYFGNYNDYYGETRLNFIVLFPYGRLGYSARMGDAGEESRWVGDLRWLPTPWWDLSAGAMLSTYALMENASSDEESDLVTLYLRSITRLRPGFDLHLEVQSLENPYYKEDVRFLVGVDLALSGGASRFGLGKGAWLQ